MEDEEASKIMNENLQLREEHQLVEQEFQRMEEEIAMLKQLHVEKSEECDRLRVEITQTFTKQEEREIHVKKMIEEMEELHENLAELDARFERSEQHNHQLREELDEHRHEMEKKIEELQGKLASSESDLASTQGELSRSKSDFDQYKKDSTAKMTSMRDTFKQSVEATSVPVSKYISQHRGSKSPLKKVRSYKLLKELDGKLQVILKEIEES